MPDLPTKTSNTPAQTAKEKKQVKSIAQMAEAKIIKDLETSLRTHARSATFACGGSVSIDDVQIRFGASGEGITVIFGQDGPSSTKDFEQLLKACQPAFFGRGGEAVLDEEYRKAGKLDTSQFATSFCPYESGIIDVVTHSLVPNSEHGRHTRSIKAELYKLNVYSAPNGKFKPHVDTPRSEDQIGSLVVSLPSAHEGGQLSVNNGGTMDQRVVFDWSNADSTEPAKIKWAAFYSDCAHEVHEVTSGHRITLTYNLFLTCGAGHLAEAPSALDSTQLPLYEGLRDALDNPGFFRRGRVLALYLNHCYAHTSDHVNFLPDSLKGADMSLWNTAKALDLKCEVVSVSEKDGGTHVYGSRFSGFEASDNLYGDWDDERGPSWGTKIPASKVTWLIPGADSSTRNWLEQSKKSNFQEVQMAYMTYGNQPELEIRYSRAAMLIRIPPYHERGTGKAGPKSIWTGIKRDPSEFKSFGEDSGESNSSSSDGMGDEDSEEEGEEGVYEDGDQEGDQYSAEDMDDIVTEEGMPRLGSLFEA